MKPRKYVYIDIRLCPSDLGKLERDGVCYINRDGGHYKVVKAQQSMGALLRLNGKLRKQIEALKEQQGAVA
jgi:hypothetical protein